ncbi:hypothetical protein [Paractinoplanes lichenicola]|uniref:Uncharacterized protein n=1 Tax=Paractinoplanes lichenicola TaxID=2802976 RepID=A0ABS1VZ23_9ACTN|nr:hypothetical protein [Actinoplanes lichenicola]MBL7259548.1 hypothetical protein [Actinoplanes lichenicola]
MRSRVVLVSLVVALSMTGCASVFDDIPDANDAMPTAAPAPKCGDDTVEAVAQKMTSDAVEVVEVIGDCTILSIGTSLGGTDTAEAREVCNVAAEVAYVGKIKAISVNGSENSELATGLKGKPCV